jgi:hypothetical protein
MRFRLSSADISPVRTFTPVTPGRLLTRSVTSRCIWARNGHAAVVRARRTVTWAPVVDLRSRVHAEVDHVVTELRVNDAEHGASHGGCTDLRFDEMLRCSASRPHQLTA